MMKLCTKCNETKLKSEFNKKAARPDGLYNFCRICQKNENKTTYEKHKAPRLEKASQYYENNKEKVAERNLLNKDKRNEYTKQWRKNNKEYCKQQNTDWRKENRQKVKDFTKVYRDANRDKVNSNRRNWLKNNPLARLSKNLRGRLWEILKTNAIPKDASVMDYLGCSIDDFKIYIGNQFLPGMTWENYGTWHLDHKIPCSAAKDKIQIEKLFHYTNLQPLWATDNVRKNNSLIYKVKLITKQEIEPFVLNIHYAKRMPNVSHSFGLFANEDLVGIITYGPTASTATTNAIINKELNIKVLELNRLCLKNNLKNEASILISKSLKLLPKDIIVLSFADSAQNHIGYVYQATNFKYYGKTDTKSEVALKSRPNSHSLSLYDESRGQEDRIGFLKAKYGDDLYWRKRSAKHRYIYITGKNKNLYNEIKYKELPYPKK